MSRAEAVWACKREVQALAGLSAAECCCWPTAADGRPAAAFVQAQDESAALAGRPVNDPPTAVLPGGSRMPLLGLGTYKLESADAVKAALQCEWR